MSKYKFTFPVALAFLLLSYIPLHAQPLTYDQPTNDYNESYITLYINNEKKETNDMPPIQLNNVTLVPLREICEALGASFEWKNEEKKIYIYHDDTLMVLEINVQDVWVNGEIIPLQTSAKIINNKIMVPLRFISEQFNCEVQWLGGDEPQIHINQLLPIVPDLPHVPDAPDLPSVPALPEADDPPVVNPTPFEHMTYSIYNYPTLTIDKNELFTYSDLTITDAYREHQIIIDLNNNYELFFENSTTQIQDDFLKAIEVITEDTTRIVLHENKIQTYNIWEDEYKIYVELLRPTEKYDKILFLDPGHGGVHPGSMANTIVEKDLNLKQALAVQALLEGNPAIKVYMSREDDTIHSPTVQEELLYRAQLANEIGAHYFISMHNNSSTSTASGTETFYYHTDPTSLNMATIVQQNIVDYCSTKDRKAKPTQDLLILNATDMPAILIETGFISNENEALLLQSDSFNNWLALAVYESILEIFDIL